MKPVRTDKLTEAVFQEQVIEAAHILGWRVAHFRGVRVQRGNGECYYQTPVQADGKGFPDLVLVKEGRTVFAELKVKPNKPDADQLAWLEDLGFEGRQEVFVWYPEDWDEITVVLTSSGPVQRFVVKVTKLGSGTAGGS